jgi:hypothetical protein
MLIVNILLMVNVSSRKTLFLPILFNLITHVFRFFFSKEATNQIISGLLANAIPGGVMSLQYAHDTILFLEKNVDMASAC